MGADFCESDLLYRAEVGVGGGGLVFWASTQEAMCCCLSITCSKQETGRTIVSELILKAQSTDLRATSTEFSSVQSTKCANPMIWQEHQTTHLLFTRVHRCKISWPLTRSDATSAEKSNSFLRHVLLGQKKTKNKKNCEIAMALQAGLFFLLYIPLRSWKCFVCDHLYFVT